MYRKPGGVRRSPRPNHLSDGDILDEPGNHNSSGCQLLASSDPAASPIYNITAKVIEFIRLDYPVARAQEKIIEAKPPPQLARRLSTGT